MKKYGVLVVDDSAVMRKEISLVVEANDYFTVIGKARNGLDALEKIAYLKPDLIILDTEMPELDGLATLKIQMQKNPVPIIVVGDAVDAVEAKKLGAIDFYEKATFIAGQMMSSEDFLEKKEQLVPSPVEVPQVHSKERISTQVAAANNQGGRILVIGSSTGGPSALQTILKDFPATFTIPVVIVQHMPQGFTKSLANRFNELCPFLVKEAEQHELLEPGTVYIAPAGVQAIFHQNEFAQYQIELKKTTDYQTLYKPSIDVALLSIAQQAKTQILTVILTGMGDDGLRGSKEVKAYGGTVFVEAEETCVVYGMPKVISKAGLADQELPLNKMARAIHPFLSI